MVLTRRVKLILIIIVVIVVVGLALGLGLGLGLKSSGSTMVPTTTAAGVVMVPTTTAAGVVMVPTTTAAFNCAAKKAQCDALATDPTKSIELDACLAELAAHNCPM